MLRHGLTNTQTKTNNNNDNVPSCACVTTFGRFQSSAYRSNQWRYRGRVDSINFMVDKRIFIVGYGLYGSSSGAADYNVRIELKKYGEVSLCVCVGLLGAGREGICWRVAVMGSDLLV